VFIVSPQSNKTSHHFTVLHLQVTSHTCAHIIIALGRMIVLQFFSMGMVW